MNTFYLAYTTHFGEYGSEGIRNNRLFDNYNEAVVYITELSKDYSNPVTEKSVPDILAVNIVDDDYTAMACVVLVKLGEDFPIYTQMSPGNPCEK